MYAKGFVRVAAASPSCRTGEVDHNVTEIINCLSKIDNADFAVFPELAITGANIKDLTLQKGLYQANLNGIKRLLNENPFSGIVIIGSYIEENDKLYNCSIVIEKNKILGIVPKYSFSSEQNGWFTSGYQANFREVELFSNIIPFGLLVFYNEDRNVCFGCEVGDDLKYPFSPHEILSSEGAILIFNTGSAIASIEANENYRLLIKAKSYCHFNAYIYAGTNSSETSSNYIYSNYKVIAEGGQVVCENEEINFQTNVIYGDIDIDKLHYLRKKNGYIKMQRCFPSSLNVSKVNYHLKNHEDFDFITPLSKTPFEVDNASYQKIIELQALGVFNRLNYIGIKKVILGVSGGLDSTLALLSLCYMCDKYQISRQNIIGITLPTSNTSDNTYLNAIQLMEKLKITSQDYNIEEEVNHQLKMINHDLKTKNITYENTQARYRTLTLMNSANLHEAIVIGTSDMSEIALGWSTFNGDHMSMYGINCGIPKTIIKKLVMYYKNIYPEISTNLDSILNTPISPELAEQQNTEDIIGKYEINDFILYHFLINGAEPAKIEWLIYKTFGLSKIDSRCYVDNFIKRFFSQQFKRLSSPEGVKVFDFSLSALALNISGDMYFNNYRKKK